MKETYYTSHHDEFPIPAHKPIKTYPKFEDSLWPVYKSIHSLTAEQLKTKELDECC